MVEIYGKDSPAFSFSGWNIWEFIKGRKKTAITILGFGLGYLIGDSATVATVSAAAIEMIFALGEYFVKEK